MCLPAWSLFIAAPAIPPSLRPLRVARSPCRRRPPPPQPPHAAAAAPNWHQPRTSSALNQDTSADRYIDLHTMQVIRAQNAHLCHSPHPNTSFGLFDTHIPLHDATQHATIRELLFTADTINLSEPQKDVVQTLLSRRSALYVAPTCHDKFPVFLDVVMRNRLWKQLVVYCAESHRAAEAAYTLLCAQLGPDRRHELQLYLDTAPTNLPDERSRVIITSPALIKTALTDCAHAPWIQHTAVLFVDTLTRSNASQWEDILLALPSQILLCVFTADLPHADHQLLPLWLETVQNSIVSITPSREASFLHRIENPQHAPLLRTFAFNAATHNSPVQVSLTLLKEMFHNSSQPSFVPKYSQCFLHGIKIISAESTSNLMFRTAQEAQYADIAALIVAHAKSVRKNARKKRTRGGKKKERTASSRAAAKRRREAAFESSLLFPALAFVAGRQEVEDAAAAVQSALGAEGNLLWDDDSKDHVADIVAAFRAANERQLTDTDINVLDVLCHGIGVVHAGIAPTVRLMVEELFRAGFIPLLTVDTFLGTAEISPLPCAKSVLVDASVLGVCDDSTKGLIDTATVAALAGRVQKDDVGNLIVLWYDESVDDEAAGYEITSTVLHRIFSSEDNYAEEHVTAPRVGRPPISSTDDYPVNKPHCVLSSSYGGVLRSVRRFGTDGYESIFEYTLNSYRGWLERAAIRATLERLDVEKTAISSRLQQENWSSIADYERLEAKMNEVHRVLRAMESRYVAVLQNRMLAQMRGTAPGGIIGVAKASESDDDVPWQQRLLKGGIKEEERENSDNDAGSTEASKASESPTGEITATEQDSSRKERVVSAVFVTLLDQDADGKRIPGMESRYLVVCILADGLWTMLPLADVVALAEEESEIVANVDLLMMPHPATFDIDPQLQWATCRPIDKTEQEAVHRISDELIARVASHDRPELVPFSIPEFEAQKRRLERAQELHKKCQWYGRDDEILELRKLRRREAELGDEIKWLQSRENQLEEELFNKHNDHRLNQQAVMAVMEDCHALTINGDCSMEMTPIGALGSVLPCEYPLFAAACLCLIDDMDKLSVSQFAALVGWIVCSGEQWTGLDRNGENGDERESDNIEAGALNYSALRERGGRENGDAEDLASEGNGIGSDEAGVHGLPGKIRSTVKEIWKALYQLHRRHVEDGEERTWSVSGIVPSTLGDRFAEAVGSFVDGASWREVVSGLDDEASCVAYEMRRVGAALDIISRSEVYTDMNEEVRELAKKALRGMERWPVKSGEWAVQMVDSGVVERTWVGNTYDKWWKGARDRIADMSAKAEVQVERTDGKVATVEAEVVEA